MGATEEATYVRELPCPLTDDDREARLHEADEKRLEVEECDEEIDRLGKEKKATGTRRNAAQARVNELVGILGAGEEVRDVVCHHVYDLPSNTVWLKRNDTDAVVEERAMTADERDEHGQMVLAETERDKEEVPS